MLNACYSKCGPWVPQEWLYLEACYKGRIPDLTPDLQKQTLDFNKTPRGCTRTLQSEKHCCGPQKTTQPQLVQVGRDESCWFSLSAYLQMGLALRKIGSKKVVWNWNLIPIKSWSTHMIQSQKHIQFNHMIISCVLTGPNFGLLFWITFKTNTRRINGFFSFQVTWIALHSLT